MFLFAFSADGNYEVRYKSNVLIYPNGEVLWVPPAIYQVRDYYSFIRDILYQSHRNIQSVWKKNVRDWYSFIQRHKISKGIRT